MSDLIERKDLGAAIDNWLAIDRYYHPYSKQKTIPVSELVDIIKLLPSAQPEIVRCRECKYRTQGVGGFYMCNRLWDQFIDDDFFCADGERRSENDTHIQV